MALASVGRRGFLKLAGVALLMPGVPAAWSEARDLMRRGSLGDVVFCRVSHGSVADAIDSLRFFFDGAMPISRSGPTLRYRNFVAAYEDIGPAGEPRAVFCGSQATLVVKPRGYRVFA